MDWSNLAADYERLGRQADVAAEYGCHKLTVASHMKAMGIATMRERPKPPSRPKSGISSAHSPLQALLEGALTRARISFETEVRVVGRYVADIRITQQPVIIEADGHWHELPDTKARDIRRDARFQAAGFQIFRFNGRQINASPDACIEEIIAATGLVHESEPVIVIRRGMLKENNPFWRDAETEYICEQCGSTFRQQRANRKQRKLFCRMKCYSDWKQDNPDSNPIHVRWADHPKMSAKDLERAAA